MDLGDCFALSRLLCSSCCDLQRTICAKNKLMLLYNRPTSGEVPLQSFAWSLLLSLAIALLSVVYFAALRLQCATSPVVYFAALRLQCATSPVVCCGRCFSLWLLLCSQSFTFSRCRFHWFAGLKLFLFRIEESN